MPERWGELRSYGGFDKVRPRMWTEPADRDELSRQLRTLREEDRKITFRGGGWSFHDQSLNADVVVSMARFDSIEVDTEASPPVVRVGSGARWRDILNACLAHNVVPGVMVTGGDTTAGGTASGDSISRFSPVWGKESTFVEQVLIMDLNGVVHSLTNPRTDSEDDDEYHRFHAVIGGFGFLGALLELTYVVLPLGELGDAGPPQVETKITPLTDLSELFARYLVASDRASAVRRERRQEVTSHPVEERPWAQWIPPGELKRLQTEAPPDAPVAESMYAVIFGAKKALLYESWMVSGAADTKKYLLYQPDSFIARLGHLLIATRAGTWLVNGLAFALAKLGQTQHVDALDDFTFFMDGNIAAQGWARSMGFELRVVQQTFVIRVPKAEDATPDERIAGALSFANEALELSRTARITPSMFDVLYIPEDESWLSSTDDLDGFALTLAYQHIALDDDRAREWQIRVIAVLEHLSRRCQELGGRVHLVKNVHCQRELLRDMYGDRIERFRSEKARWDGDEVICNPFYDRLLAR